ncbi:unnamed protein product [Candida parapsilosis]|uniref:MFS domain-containing protein n=1 Tax=Candida parapsilosis (strain CDC 317 / ATCC MYA-4646) TaxID=578454 RepID=G8B8R3_CANPC|nr:uncharacterized protein CPAR2_108880 [Candida parapsilosis]CCE40849.1 hypothetical protein CPAR2_108880 [Candida parapsilosis]
MPKGFWEQMKGFPTWQLTLICLIRLGEPMVFTSIFAYIFFMIQDFNITDNSAEIATYAGYLSASFAIFQFLFSVQYAQASVRFGRKPVLLFGVIGTALSSLLFGFSSTFTMALIARSLMGALNGNIAVMRVAIGEVAVQKKHQNMAFTALSVMWGIGSIIGPLIGSSSWFTRPHKARSPELTNYNDFVNKHPYAMSNIVLAGYLFFSFVMGFLFLEETSEKFKNRKDYGLVVGDWILKRLGLDVPIRFWDKLSVDVEQLHERTELLQPSEIYSAVDGDDEEGAENEEEIDNTLISRRFGDAARRRYSSEQLGPVVSNDGHSISANVSQSFTKEVFTVPVVQTVMSNFLLCFHTVLYSEFMPVLLASQLSVDKLSFPFTIVGGFGWQTNDIGALLSSTGIIGSLAVIFLFPVLDHHFKSITILRMSYSLVPLAYAIIPYFLFATPEYNLSNNKQLSTGLLYITSMVICGSVSVAFPTTMILVHRASPEKHRALINGSSLSLNSLARGVSPIIFGHFMTWCNEHEVGSVPWLVLGALALICLIQSFYMVDYDDEQE